MRKTHGYGGKERLYNVWSSMRDRCRNPACKDYDYYGGRGISICKDWDDYMIFRNWAYSNGYEDGSGLSIDRINNDGDYCPENCRFVSRKVQANNMSTNHLITYNGITKNISGWSEDTGIPFDVLDSRINAYRWDTERALTTPVNGHRIRFNINGEDKSLRELSNEYGINAHTLYNRLFIYGYSIDDALSMPVGKRRK